MAELFKVNAPVRKPLFEGVQGENEARSIRFDITPWVEELGDGAVTATAKRSQDSQPYPVTVTKDGNTVTWKPTSTDTAFAGVGSFQLEYTVDDVLAKTCIWSTMVAPSLDPAGDPPDPYDNWLAEMREIAADAIQAAQDAEDSADDAQAEVYEAEAWAKGTKNGTPVSSTDAQYQNNSKYYSEESYKNAEAWAVGQRGGVDVPSTDPTYENNAKYWAGQAEELKDETQEIVDEARADVFDAMDGLHEETTAGSALQLISDKYTENKEPYLFRKSIAGDRELDTLVGGSVAWNELAGGSMRPSMTREGVAYTPNSDGSFVLNGTADTTDWWMVTPYDTPSIVGHKYILWDANRSGIEGQYGLCYGNIGIAVYGNKSIIVNSRATTEKVGYAYTNGAVINNVTFKPVLIDLTQMFGSAIADRLYAMEQAQAGSGVAWFRERFPKDYYAYDTGELMSVKTSAHETVGFNQWDEEYATGDIAEATGAYNASANPPKLCSKNFIPVLPNTAYYCLFPIASSTFNKVFYYDAEQNFISFETVGRSMEKTTPSNARYMKFVLALNYGTTYNHDICINLSSDRNGEYQPYIKHTYALDDIELRGVAKLNGTDIYFDGDTYEADGTVTRRFGIVDLGTLEYSVMSSDNHIFTASVPNLKSATTTQERKTGIFCAKYPVSESVAIDASMTDKSILRVGALVVRDTAYTTGQQIKTALSGVYLVYELATPTTETADPFTSPQIVDAYGTERYVDERTVAVPVGHVTKYPDNLREKLDGLPWDFSSLIAPTEKSYTATRNYTTGALLIVNNTLYKVTANIANGGAITPNTNVVATTLSEVISAL